jgi:hypothetical protein
MKQQPEDPRLDYCVVFFDYMSNNYVFTFTMKKAMTLDEFYDFLPMNEVMVFPFITKDQNNKLDQDVQSRKLDEVYEEWFIPKKLKNNLS